MSLERGYTWTDRRLRVQGYSVAGVTTTIGLPDFRTLVDVGQGLPFQVGYPVIALTHGHLDHASGLPYLLGQRSMFGQGEALILAPRELSSPIEQIISLWAKIEDHRYQYRLLPVVEGDRVQLGEDSFVEVFKTFHRVPSVGYAFGRIRKRLRSELRSLRQDELRNVIQTGQSVTEQHETIEVAVTGDTKSEFTGSELVRSARVVVMEVTFWDERRARDQARHWGHIHADELPEILAVLRAEKILLKHISARHSPRQVETVIESLLSPNDRARVEVFGRPQT